MLVVDGRGLRAQSVTRCSEVNTPAVSIRLAGGYYLDNLTRVIRDLQPVLAIEEPSRVEIDLSSLTFMGPTALATTLASLSRLRQMGLFADGFITPPGHGFMHTYLKRMDFYNVLFEEVDLTWDHVEKHESKGLRECRHFIEDAECRGAAKALSDALAEKVSTDSLARLALEMCLTELAENVFYHADTPLGGYAAAQAFGSTREIEVAIVDLGRGIRNSLAVNPDHAPAATTDLSSILKAMEPTVTATPERNSGLGLAFTQHLLEVNRGRLMIRSGNGHVQVGERLVSKVEQHRLPGTAVALRLRTDQSFDFNRAYALLRHAIIVRTNTDPAEDGDL